MGIRDYEHEFMLEFDENKQQKGFTPSEYFEAGVTLERIEKEKARQRMTEGTNQYSPRTESAQGLETGKTDTIVAKAIGIGGKTKYQQLKYVKRNAPAEIVHALPRLAAAVNMNVEWLASRACMHCHG